MLIKFCGMRDQMDLNYASGLGVDFCGFIFHAQSPRHISPEAASGLESFNMARVGVFVNNNAKTINAAMKQAKLDYAQLHGDQDRSCCIAVGIERVVKVLWPARHASLASLQMEAEGFAPFCAMYLLDAGSSGGGSGKTLDWNALAGLDLPHPFLLAGGLGAGNLEEAVTACRPQGLDFNSGIEDAPGKKNRRKMLSVMNILKQL